MDVIGRAGQDHIVFFGALKESIQKRFISFDFLLNDAVVDCRLVLRQGFVALLIKCVTQRLFLLLRLAISSFEVGFDDRLRVGAQLLRLLFQHRNLLIEVPHFRIFFRVLQ